MKNKFYIDDDVVLAKTNPGKVGRVISIGCPEEYKNTQKGSIFPWDIEFGEWENYPIYLIKFYNATRNFSLETFKKIVGSAEINFMHDNNLTIEEFYLQQPLTVWVMAPEQDLELVSRATSDILEEYNGNFSK
mgnify:CR=1 FL=1